MIFDDNTALRRCRVSNPPGNGVRGLVPCSESQSATPMQGCAMFKTTPPTTETQADIALAQDVDGLHRRTLLRLALAGGAMSLAPMAMAQGGTPKKGGTLTIGADADPIGLDPVTVSAF
jgi:hypothetical protein